ncbi:MAG: ribbon-helix-helix protein, CopG family [Proteobacteria bacterium]|nr:ribbon-helix-helix protein, CopG family [Pseudomonadota bacterium]MYJ95941.1 ribbon-helix-helix protein, CopG family [Pseudomonadota bacterium]
MKTAVSIPDEIFERAERLAKRNGRSRSDLYASALDEYVARHSPDEVTDTMNRVCERVGDEEDAFVAAASLRTLDRIEW